MSEKAGAAFQGDANSPGYHGSTGLLPLTGDDAAGVLLAEAIRSLAWQALVPRDADPLLRAAMAALFNRRSGSAFWADRRAVCFDRNLARAILADLLVTNFVPLDPALPRGFLQTSETHRPGSLPATHAAAPYIEGHGFREATTILLVEKNPQIADLIRWTLDLHGGFQVISLPHEQAAPWLDEARLRGQCPDVILLDFKKWCGDGQYFLRHMVELWAPSCPAPPVVVLTTDQDDHQELGVPVIHKPFHARELLALLQEVTRDAKRGEEYRAR